MENFSISEDDDSKEKGENIVSDNTQNTPRQIPIEVFQDDSVLNEDQACDNDLEIIGTILDLDESEIQQLLTVEELQGNRTSLIITHEDGSTEETETEVTCLGVTPEEGHRNSLHIQEIVLATNKIQEELAKQNEVKDKDHKNIDDVSLPTVENSSELENLSEIENPNIIHDTDDNLSHQVEIIAENEAKCQREDKESDELIQGKDILDVSKEIKTCKTEQIRIIPISLPDGRHIINRSISNDVIEKCRNDQPTLNIKKESANDSKMTVSVNQMNESSIHANIFHPQDIDACNLSNQINSDNSEDTSADEGSVKQTEAAATLSISNPPTDTCSESDNTVSSSVQQISTTSKYEICESKNKKEKRSNNSNHPVKSEENEPKNKYRTIPIKIERSDSCKTEVKQSNLSEKISCLDAKIPINTSAQLKESVSDKGLSSENLNMKSVRTVPIQRLNSDSSCDSFSNVMTKSLSKESLGQQTQKIKMGTAAIRIPIQVQKTIEAPTGEETKHGLEGEVSSLKPPHSVRTVPILRQSLSDSGVSPSFSNKQSSRSRNASSQSMRDEKLQKVHEQLEEARIKVAAQADALSEGYEHLIERSGNRSKSLETGQRYDLLGAKPKQTPSRGQKDRSLQDIDKDIETIWKELQDLDKPSISGKEDSSQQLSEPLSEKPLLKPAWKGESSSSKQNKTSVSNPNISSTNLKKSSSSSSSRHTIWDIPEKKYEPGVGASLSSSWDNKPNYFPSKSNTHFSFLPKAETRPGFIQPAYGGEDRGQSIDKTENRRSPPRPFKSKGSGSASDLRKSCLKTQSTQSLKSRSQSPSVVKFSPKTPKKDQSGVEVTDPPFEWIEFRRKDGEIVKGTVLPPIHRDNDVKIPKHVPIVNMVLEDSSKDLCHKAYEAVQLKETTKPQTVSCDAETQTEKVEKKGGCFIM